MVRARADGRTVASGHWEGGLRVFQAGCMRPLGALPFHKGSVNALAFPPATAGAGSGAGSHDPRECEFEFASGSADHSVALWNVYGPGSEREP